MISWVWADSSSAPHIQIRLRQHSQLPQLHTEMPPQTYLPSNRRNRSELLGNRWEFLILGVGISKALGLPPCSGILWLILAPVFLRSATPCVSTRLSPWDALSPSSCESKAPRSDRPRSLLLCSSSVRHRGHRRLSWYRTPLGLPYGPRPSDGERSSSLPAPHPSRRIHPCRQPSRLPGILQAYTVADRPRDFLTVLTDPAWIRTVREETACGRPRGEDLAITD